MRPVTTFSYLAVLIAVMLVFTACGDDDTGTLTPTSQADQADEPTTDDGTDQPATDDEEDSGDDGGTLSELEDVLDNLDDFDFGDGAAIVTIGDTTYEFALGGSSTVDSTTYFGVCQTLFNVIFGEGYDPEGRDITMSFEIPPEDWDTYEDERYDSPQIEVEDDSTGEFITWAADESLQEIFPDAAGVEQSRVDEWTTNGTVASGTATFIQIEFGTPKEGATPVQGTFQIGCAEE